MFFIFGISSKEKEIDFTQTIVCSNCGAYGSLKVFMTYSYFSLFFIPIIRWNKKYYVRKTCCGSLYTIDSDLGKDIENGIVNKIQDKDLTALKVNHNRRGVCSNCNNSLESNYEFCPKCGKKV